MFRIIDELFEKLPPLVVTLDQHRFGALVLLALAVVGCMGLRAFHSKV